MFAKQVEQVEKVASSDLLLSCMKKVAQYTSPLGGRDITVHYKR
jgi:hypothetical protein